MRPGFSLNHTPPGRYSHVPNPAFSNDSTASNVPAPHITLLGGDERLAKLHQSLATDAIFPLSDSPRSFQECQALLKNYLRDNYVFQRPREAYTFMKLLTNSNNVYGNWVRLDYDAITAC